MDDEPILGAAEVVLRELHERARDEGLGPHDSAKVWLTARVIAKRCRARRLVDGLTQDRLYEALLRHVEMVRVGERRIRNSSFPSVRTLETLWAAIDRETPIGRKPLVEDIRVDSPLLQDEAGLAPQAGQGDAEGVEDEGDAPEIFFSYRMRDESVVREIAKRLDAAGHSIWIAGKRIAAGRNINQEVIDAIRAAKRQIVYLSRDTFRSLWVGKEMLVGAGLELAQTVVLQSGDRELVGLIADWMEGQDSHYRHLADYDGPSGKAMNDFQKSLRDRLTADEVYLYPDPPEAPPHRRMHPLSKLPGALEAAGHRRQGPPRYGRHGD